MGRQLKLQVWNPIQEVSRETQTQQGETKNKAQKEILAFDTQHYSKE
jgi:hypothetical protein